MRFSAATVLSLVVTAAIVTLASAAGLFLESFDGAPSAPQTYSNPHNWDIFPSGLDTRENGTYAQLAHHGPACDRPGYPYTSANSHPLVSTQDQVFICNNHLMTANGLTGYGAIYMVPPAMADFSGGTTKVSWDMSTLRTAARDWVYFTLMPFDGHNKYAYNNNDQAVPPNNVNIKLEGENRFVVTQRVGGGGDVTISGDAFTTWDMIQAANGVSPDAARRDSFEIDLSSTHLRVCLNGNNAGQTYTYQGRSGFCWVDSDLPTPLSSSVWRNQAVFMMTHVTYNPEKSCSSGEDQFFIVHNPTGDANCPPDTWHWDNVNITPAVQFTIINPQQQFAAFADPGGTNTVTFATPAPAGAHLSYVAAGDCTQQRFSVDGGAHWTNAVAQPATTQCQHPENGGEYWTAIPAGTTSVKFTGQATFGVWSAAGIAIWALGQPQPGSPPAAPQPPGQPVPAQQPAQKVLVGDVFHSAWVDQTAYPRLAPGATSSVTVRFRNTGTQTWQLGVQGAQVNLGVAGDVTTYADLGLAVNWLSPNRPATTRESAVAPGEVGTFTFAVRAPSSQGLYRIPLRLVADGIAWLDDQGVYIEVTSDGGFHSAWISESAWPTLRPGEVSAPLSVVFRNTGGSAWVRGSTSQLNLGVSRDTAAWAGLGVGWPTGDRPAVQTEASVSPGSTATFTFQIRAPSSAGTHVLSLQPVVDGVAWLEDEGVYIVVNVVP
jgi:hypothetical protein